MQIKDPQSQRVIAYSVLLTAFIAYRFVITTHLWKTGLRSTWYLFGPPPA